MIGGTIEKTLAFYFMNFCFIYEFHLDHVAVELVVRRCYLNDKTS